MKNELLTKQKIAMVRRDPVAMMTGKMLNLVWATYLYSNGLVVVVEGQDKLFLEINKELTMDV